MNGPDLMTISRPDDVTGAGELIDRNMGGVIQGNQEYNQYARDASLQSAPFETVGGPDAASMSSGQSKMGTFEFLARGGIDNTAKGLANNISEKRRKKEQIAQFEKLLSMNEQGGKLLYDDAIKTYGPEIREWIPPVSFFYDQETGAFMPYKYAERVAYGITAYEKAKAKAQQVQTISGSLAGAQSRQEAAAGVIGAGGDVKEYDDAIKTLPPAMTDKDRSDIAVNDERIKTYGSQQGLNDARAKTYETEQSLNRAKQGYYNRMPKAGSGGSGGRPKTPQDNINQLQDRIIKYENLIRTSRAELRDPNRNPDADSDMEIAKRIKSYERAVGELKRDIDREKALITSAAADEELPSVESYVLSDEIMSSIYKDIPDGYTLDEENLEVLNESGEPEPGMYDELILSRVLLRMDDEGIKLPQLGPSQGGRAALIKQSIAKVGLKSTLDALQQLKASSGGAK